MTVREEFVKAVIETHTELKFEDPKIQEGVRRLATDLANQWIESNSIEFILFKLGFIKGEEQGSKK